MSRVRAIISVSLIDERGRRVTCADEHDIQSRADVHAAAGRMVSAASEVIGLRDLRPPEPFVTAAPAAPAAPASEAA